MVDNRLPSPSRNDPRNYNPLPCCGVALPVVGATPLRSPEMNPPLKIACVAGLVLSFLMWIFLSLVELLHAESMLMPISALLITGFAMFSVFIRSKPLDAISATLSLFPIALLFNGMVSGHSEGSQVPIGVSILIGFWALFYAFVAVCLGARMLSGNPAAHTPKNQEAEPQR